MIHGKKHEKRKQGQNWKKAGPQHLIKHSECCNSEYCGTNPPQEHSDESDSNKAFEILFIKSSMQQNACKISSQSWIVYHIQTHS